MSAEMIVTVAHPPAVQTRRCSALADYWALTKPEVNFLILITTAAGFYLGCVSGGKEFSFAPLFNTLVGTLLVASGTATLNQYIERDHDAQMRRTARRPAASGRLAPRTVLTFGIVLSVLGIVYLWVAAGLLSSLLALLTLSAYLFLYTPLKRRTALCVVVGAFPGAMPPLIGWAGASSHLNIEAWMLYAFVFLWQFPHFMAIAWMYREDYDRAGYLVLPKGGVRDSFVDVETRLPLIGLLTMTMLPWPAVHSRLIYGCGVLLSLAFLYFGSRFALERSRLSARRLLAASIVYLPLLFALRMADAAFQVQAAIHSAQ